MIDERQLREVLERRAETISATPTDVPNAIRRARRRLARNAAVAGLASLVVIAGAVAGLRMIHATPTPPRPATPPPSPAKLGTLAYGVDGDIYVAELDGSSALRIADGRPPSECGGRDEYWGEGSIWSPDGRYVAYRRRNCNAPAPDQHPWSHVVLSDPEGHVVAEFPGEGWDISWSPDSTRVAVWVGLFKTIGVFGVDGSRQALLTMPPGHGLGGDYDPVWLPDGESLRVHDVVIPVDGSTPYYIDPRTPYGFGSSSLGSGDVTSPDGTRVAYVTRKSLVVAEADGSNPQVVFRGDGSDLPAVIDFSPEGDRILFSRTEDGVSSLWSIDVDGSGLRRLVAGTAWGDWLLPRPTP